MSRVLRLLLPYRKVELTTRLAPDQIVAALEREARAALSLGAFVGTTLDGRVLKFYGSWDDTGFDLRRVVAGRRSFTPRIRGTIAPAPGGSVIQVTMAPSWFNWGFAAAWCAGMAFCTVSYARRGRALDSSLGELLILSLILAFAALTFVYEARKARMLLLTMFKTTSWRSR